MTIASGLAVLLAFGGVVATIARMRQQLTNHISWADREAAKIETSRSNYMTRAEYEMMHDRIEKIVTREEFDARMDAQDARLARIEGHLDAIRNGR